MKNSRRRRHCHMSRPDLRKRHTPRQRRTFAMPALPAQMTAIAIRAPGAADMLVPEQRPLPRPADGEVLVKVAAAGVNRPDVMQRQGLYPPPPGATDIPGLEIAGEVVALGAGVKRWKLGDKVMALVVGGGYAEYCPAHESHALPVPPGLAFVAAAKAATHGKGADVVLDMVGGDYIERNYEAAAVEGRVVQIAFQRSPKATVDFR